MRAPGDPRPGDLQPGGLNSFTTTAAAAPLLRVALAATGANGLSHDSFRMIGKITTSRRSSAGDVVGRVETTTLVEAERRLLVSLGFFT